MTDTYKVLGSITLADGSGQLLYTAPSYTQTLISNISVINTTGASVNFTIKVSNYNLYVNNSIAANSSITLEPGLALSGGDYIIVMGSGLSFSAYGVELS